MIGAQPVTVRDARPENAEAIGRLSRTLAAHVADPDPGRDAAGIVAACFGPDRWIEVILAERRGEIVGLAAWCRRFELHTRERSLWLADLVVAETARREGVGHLLVQSIHQRAQAMGCGTIVADLWVDNASARAFYDRIGARANTEIEIRVIDLPMR
ncbi:MAG TPA: GNAT family N-acetyltransferase [Amaricoccus sp.]|uniref:GNAT family N-acetyltransferase n=1 Tax=Amaricoccus sp. TaxID=1872485 RepID=UPI002B8A9A4A|nr:GNAT family N-acetyltransferase [Amaricoccus sp.]HMQ93466.1 GNAT family N-acetyltransferase [Amaricoccus sp.]HMR53673.1 GNAT family N-acetyltransferase [Amaricoccus sp.]HMU00729.1 GNAT family N-acetyltransferase [Amaricoccus sp.]